MFTTDLVGVLPDGNYDPLFQFTWESSFNQLGCTTPGQGNCGTGGILITGTDFNGIVGSYPGEDPNLIDGVGTGGVTILSEEYLSGLATPLTTPLPATWLLMLTGLIGLPAMATRSPITRSVQTKCAKNYGHH